MEEGIAMMTKTLVKTPGGDAKALGGDTKKPEKVIA